MNLNSIAFWKGVFGREIGTARTYVFCPEIEDLLLSIIGLRPNFNSSEDIEVKPLKFSSLFHNKSIQRKEVPRQAMYAVQLGYLGCIFRLFRLKPEDC